jgi:hypothetical protein
MANSTQTITWSPANNSITASRPFWNANGTITTRSIVERAGVSVYTDLDANTTIEHDVVFGIGELL